MPLGSAVVFDLDGTLLDTLDDLTTALNQVLASEGLPQHTRDQCRYLVGDGARLFVERALPPDSRADTALVDHVLERFRRQYSQHLVLETRPYPGIEELLDLLEKNAVPKAILSNKPDPLTQTVVRQLLGRWSWTFVAGEGPGTPKKPDPTGARAACAALSRPAANCLFVGDTPIDLRTARAAQMIPIGVLWGFRTKEELLAERPHALLTSPAELSSFLAN